MRKMLLATAVVCGFGLSLPAFAQAPPPAPAEAPAPADAAAPAADAPAKAPMHHGAVSHHAAHGTAENTKGDIAPRLPSPKLAENASPDDYLGAAKSALKMHKTGEAQEALEMAETRLLDRSTPADQANTPDAGPRIASIKTALQAVAGKDMAGANTAIDAAMTGKDGHPDMPMHKGAHGMMHHKHMMMKHGDMPPADAPPAPAAQ